MMAKCIYIYIYIYIWFACMNMYIYVYHIYTQKTYTEAVVALADGYSLTQVYIRVHLWCACICTRICMIYTNMYDICASHAHMYVYRHMYIHIYTYIFIYTYVYPYVNINISHRYISYLDIYIHKSIIHICTCTLYIIEFITRSYICVCINIQSQIHDLFGPICSLASTESCLKWMHHVKHMNESCQEWLSHVTKEHAIRPCCCHNMTIQEYICTNTHIYIYIRISV